MTCLRLLCKSYFNERTPRRLYFFDTLGSKIDKLCISNKAKFESEQLQFDWLELSPFQDQTQRTAKQYPNIALKTIYFAEIGNKPILFPNQEKRLFYLLMECGC